MNLFWGGLTLLYAVDLGLCLHIYKWYTDINPGRLFRDLYLTDSSHSVPPSHSESVKRNERNKILSFHYFVATEYQLKGFNSCQSFSSLKNLTRNKSSGNFGFPVLPIMGALEDLPNQYFHGIFIWLQNKETQIIDVHTRLNVDFVLQITISMPLNFTWSAFLIFRAFPCNLPVTFSWHLLLSTTFNRHSETVLVIYILIWFFWKITLILSLRRDQHIKQNTNKQTMVGTTSEFEFLSFLFCSIWFVALIYRVRQHIHEISFSTPRQSYCSIHMLKKFQKAFISS